VEIAPVGGCIPFVVADDDDDDEDEDEEDDDASIASKRYPTPRLILVADGKSRRSLTPKQSNEITQSRNPAPETERRQLLKSCVIFGISLLCL